MFEFFQKLFDHVEGDLTAAVGLVVDAQDCGSHPCGKQHNPGNRKLSQRLLTCITIPPGMQQFIHIDVVDDLLLMSPVHIYEKIIQLCSEGVI